MELNEKINADIVSQCINGYEWPSELLIRTKSLKLFENKLDYEGFFKTTKSFKNSLPVVITILSKEYINVGRLWLTMIKRTTLRQYIVIAADEESFIFLRSTSEPSCRVCLGEFDEHEISFLSKTGFTGKGLSITALKFPIVKELLQLNFDIFLMDIDAILLGDLPLDFFSNFDVAFQRVYYFPKPIAKVWKFAACSGFVWLKSNVNTLLLLEKVIEHQLTVYSDQIAFNIALWENKIKWIYPVYSDEKTATELSKKDFFIKNHREKIYGFSERNEMKICALPTDSFWRNNFIPFEISNALVFHPNSPKSEEGKIQVFRNYKLI